MLVAGCPCASNRVRINLMNVGSKPATHMTLNVNTFSLIMHRHTHTDGMV